MIVSHPSHRNASRRRRAKSRSLEAIYYEQRPEGVSRVDWTTVLDAFLVEWARSLSTDPVQRLARPRAHAA
ncbi:MAG: hypothetical protein C0485_19070 [Pirellula sp.]|nr:hypothetical protein [Pirellula sp.]